MFNDNVLIMSKRKISRFLPDTPEEISFLGSSVNRLGSALAAVSVVQENIPWTLVCIIVIWFGYEVEKYFQMYIKKENENEG